MNQLSAWAKQGAIFEMVILPTSLADQDHLHEKDNVRHFIADQDHLREMGNLLNSVTDCLLDGAHLRGTSKEHWQGAHRILRFRPHFRRFQRPKNS